MTAPFQIDPNQADGAAGQWDGQLPDLSATPPSSNGRNGGAAAEAATSVTGAAGQRTAALQAALGQTSATTRAGVDAYQDQEGASAQSLSAGGGGMKPSELSGLMKDMVSAVVGTEQAFFQSLSSLSSAGGAAVSAGSSAVSSLVSSLAKGGAASPPPLGGGNGEVNETADDRQEQHHHDGGEGARSAAPRVEAVRAR